MPGAKAEMSVELRSLAGVDPAATVVRYGRFSDAELAEERSTGITIGTAEIELFANKRYCNLVIYILYYDMNSAVIVIARMICSLIWYDPTSFPAHDEPGPSRLQSTC